MTIDRSAPAAAPLNVALGTIAALSVLMALVLVALLPAEDPAGPLLLLFPLDMLIYVTAGLLAWHRRPQNRFGLVLVISGLSLWAAGFANSEVPALQIAGGLLATVPLAAVVHLLHAFPTGSLRGRTSIATVVAGYAAAVPLHVLALAVPNTATDLAQDAVGIGVMSATAVVLARRLVASPPSRRRVLAPLYAGGVLAVVFLPLAPQVLAPLGVLTPLGIGVMQVIVLGLVPIAFTVALAIGGFAPTVGQDQLLVWLGAAGSERLDLAQLLARGLDDTSLEIWFWIPERNTYVRMDGTPVATELGRGRAMHVVTLDERRIGAIHYDRNAIADAEIVAHAAGIVAIALDRERLLAELRLNRAELQRSRERLVEAADAERSRIARDLHDGLQVQLVLLALEAQQLSRSTPAVTDAATSLRRGIDAAAAQLRRTVHEVMPAALVERGLSSAADDLIDRMPIPTAFHLGIRDGEATPAVETTVYFVLAEALANVVKHSSASQVAVRVTRSGDRLRVVVDDDGRGGASRGSGLAGIADRVDVLGGTLALHSPPGVGTTLDVEVPCGS